MKKRYLTKLQTIINFIIDKGVYVGYVLAFCIGLQFVGLSLNYISSFSAINYAGSALLGIVQSVGYLFNSLGNIPILRDIPIVNNILKFPGYLLSPLSSLTSFILPYLPIVSLTSFLGYQIYSKFNIQEIVTFLTKYENTFLIGIGASTLKDILYPFTQPGGLKQYINDRIEHYKNHSLTFLLVSSASSIAASTAAYFTLGLLPLPMVPALAQIIIFKKTFSAGFNTSLAQKIDNTFIKYSHVINKIIPTAIGISSYASMVALFKTGAMQQISSTIRTNFWSLGSFAKTSVGSGIAIINILPIAYRYLRPIVSKNLEPIASRYLPSKVYTYLFSEDPTKVQKNLSSSIWESQSKNFIYSMGATVSLAIVTFTGGVAIAPTLLSASLYTAAQSLIFSVGSLVYMYNYEEDNFKKHIDEVEISMRNKTIPSLVSNLTGVGFALLGVFIGQNLPFTQLPKAFDLVPIFTRNFSIIAAGIIGFIGGKKMADNYCDSHIKIAEAKDPVLVPPIASTVPIIPHVAALNSNRNSIGSIAI